MDAYIYNNIILTIKVGLAVCTIAAYITHIIIIIIIIILLLLYIHGIHGCLHI